MHRIFTTSLCLIGLLLSTTAAAGARCGYYAGYGYRCFGDQGGTGGQVFKEMDENTEKCGYFDPGCKKQQRPAANEPPSTTEQSPPRPQSDQNYQPPQSDGAWTAPQSDGDWKPPQSDGTWKSPQSDDNYKSPAIDPD